MAAASSHSGSPAFLSPVATPEVRSPTLTQSEPATQSPRLAVPALTTSPATSAPTSTSTPATTSATTPAVPIITLGGSSAAAPSSSTSAAAKKPAAKKSLGAKRLVSCAIVFSAVRVRALLSCPLT